MILVYHKVSLESPTHWWVTADAFDAQLADLQSFDVVRLDEYDPSNSRHVVITFDGPYADVVTYGLPLLEKWGYPFEVFVIGGWVGKENTFDQHVEPRARFADLRQLDQLVKAGGRLQWHTRSHCRLADLDEQSLALELEPQAELRTRFGAPHFEWFAYPHGETSEKVSALVKTRFSGAVAVTGGGKEDRWALPRREVSQTTSLTTSTVSIVIANYNYGRYLPQAVESVLTQSRPPDQLIIIDDGSTDGSMDVVERYRDHATIIENGQNLGIVQTFRRAVDQCTGDYVAFLGADNRFRQDYVERCKAALDSDLEAAVAYTDVALFGPRSHILAGQVQATPTLGTDVYVWRFPDPTPDALARLETVNFLHGSSMYRRKDYEAVGGYQQSGGPEDHHLFRRMLATGRRAVHVKEPVLEYRQHSGEQANTLLVAQLETAHWHGEACRRRGELEQANVVNQELADRLEAAQEREALMARLEEKLVALRGDLHLANVQIGELSQRSQELDSVYAGGWWRLRQRLRPILAPASKVRRRLRKRPDC